MQLEKIIFSKHTFLQIFLLSQLLISNTTICQGQNNCEDDFKFITQAYNIGDWSSTKNAAINFINKMWDKNEIYFSRNQSKNADDCKNNISQVYSYLIKSYIRLYNLDSAKFYYFDALKNEYKINIDTTDKKIFNDLGILKKNSIDLYIGIISVSYKEHQLGLRYGLSSRLFLDASLNHRHFSHLSDLGDGVFGKPLKRDSAFPNYSFDIRGYEAYLETESYVKMPIFVSQNDVNIFYISPGVFVTYYLNSHVISWSLTRHVSPTIEDKATMPSHLDNKNHHYTQIDTFGVEMDLKQLYKDRINYGFLMNIGSSINLKNRWQLFFEIKFAVGKNNQYRNTKFSSYKPGVDYFFLVVGIGKKYYRIKEPKKSGLNF